MTAWREWSQSLAGAAHDVGGLGGGWLAGAVDGGAQKHPLAPRCPRQQPELNREHEHPADRAYAPCSPAAGTAVIHEGQNDAAQDGEAADDPENSPRDNDLKGQQDEANDEEDDNRVHSTSLVTWSPKSVWSVTMTAVPGSAEPNSIRAS